MTKMNIKAGTEVYGRKYISSWSSDNPHSGPLRMFETGSEIVLEMLQSGLTHTGLDYVVQKGVRLSDYSKIFEVWNKSGELVGYGKVQRYELEEE